MLGIARPVNHARAWAVTPAHGLAQPGMELACLPEGGPLTPTIESSQPSPHSQPKPAAYRM